MSGLRASPAALGEPSPYAAMVHLSGRRRGTSQLLSDDRVTVGSSAADQVLVAEPAEAGTGTPIKGARRYISVAGDPGRTLATLEKRGQTYELRAGLGAEVFVNGEPVESLVLASGDVLEIGKGGTVLRFRLYPAARGPYKSMREAFSDCIDCARHGGHGVLDRTGIVLAGVPYELATKTTPAMRVTFLALLFLLLVTTGVAIVRNVSLERRFAAELGRIQGLEALLARTERATYSRADFDAARAELEALIGESLGRVEALEARAGAPARIIDAAAEAVVFLQGSFGFVEPQSGRPLRYAVGPGGGPVRLADGSNAITLEGSGPIVEVLYTGTAFVASDAGHLLTNRHVALPWFYDQSAQRMISQGLQPVMQRLIGYLPGLEEPFDVELVEASDSSDVALLKCQAPTSSVRPLRLAAAVPKAGDEVIVMGYPTGMRAVMARAGERFASALSASGPLDFWQVAHKLAEGGYLTPLATRGIVGQITEVTIVYDAVTMSGGSGGPVINLDGEVVAVNSAIIPGFTGSNLGVPASEAARLLDAASELRRP